MSLAVDRLPKHLRRFVVEQNYSKYTPQEHATWRYIMRQNRAFYAEHAVAIYVQGLQKTGIPIDRIPNIQEMDDCLSEFGYGAVGICGFIPPAIFLEFQALGVMPIATDMRTVNHIGYTPAPDIVHEAAGHAPIVADKDYRDYLRHYGKIANKAISSIEDVRLYEAIRYLSDIKENPDTSKGEIERAQEQLDAASKAVTFVSESAKVGRMGWWTIEYGLVGTPEKPQIYGAGLLSSVAEGQSCLSANVRKIPLTLACVDQSYDITEPQPQLFIAPSLPALVEPLAQLEATMAYMRGGAYGCATAEQAKTVNTIQLDSGIQCGGIVEHFAADGEHVDFFKLTGPSQIAQNGRQITGQGKDYHHHGFSTPIGRWKKLPNKPSHLLSDTELEGLGISPGKDTSLEFQNGFVVKGRVERLIRGANSELMMIVWSNCTVARGDQITFKPEWGNFDMAIGSKVVSVSSGPPDRDAYGEYEIGFASTSPGRQSPFTSQERQAFEMYQQVRSLRELSQSEVQTRLPELAQKVLQTHSHEWLLALEVVEVARQRLSLKKSSQENWLQKLYSTLGNFKHDPAVSDLVEKGLRISDVAD